MLKIFYGDVIKGKMRLYDAPGFNKYIASLKGSIKLTVAKFERQRSIPQNRWLFGVAYKLIEDHTGHSKEDIHEMLLNALGARKVVSFTTKSGTHTISTVKRSSEYTTAEMKIYMELVQQWAAEVLEVVIPDPQSVEVEDKDTFGEPLRV